METPRWAWYDAQDSVHKIGEAQQDVEHVAQCLKKLSQHLAGVSGDLTPAMQRFHRAAMDELQDRHTRAAIACEQRVGLRRRHEAIADCVAAALVSREALCAAVVGGFSASPDSVLDMGLTADAGGDSRGSALDDDNDDDVKGRGGKQVSRGHSDDEQQHSAAKGDLRLENPGAPPTTGPSTSASATLAHPHNRRQRA